MLGQPLEGLVAEEEFMGACSDRAHRLITGSQVDVTNLTNLTVLHFISAVIHWQGAYVRLPFRPIADN